jgi:hypothetical protein
MRRRATEDRPNVLRRVIILPRGAIGFILLIVGHARMVGHAMVQVIFVQISVHPGTLMPKHFVIL